MLQLVLVSALALSASAQFQGMGSVPAACASKCASISAMQGACSTASQECVQQICAVSVLFL